MVDTDVVRCCRRQCTARGHAVWAGSASLPDGAVPPGEIVRLCQIALEDKNVSKCVYATRVGGEGTVVERTLLRRISGWTFATLVQVLFAFPFRDTQCGFKIVPRGAYERIRHRTRENRFCFDIEMTSLLIQSGGEILPIPINWSERPGSTLRPTNVLDMFLSVLKLRRRLGVEPADGGP